MSDREKLKCLEATSGAHIPMCKWIIYCHVANSRNTLKVCKPIASSWSGYYNCSHFHRELKRGPERLSSFSKSQIYHWWNQVSKLGMHISEYVIFLPLTQPAQHMNQDFNLHLLCQVTIISVLTGHFFRQQKFVTKLKKIRTEILIQTSILRCLSLCYFYLLVNCIWISV